VAGGVTNPGDCRRRQLDASSPRLLSSGGSLCRRDGRDGE
jgi:hypothetical protein